MNPRILILKQFFRYFITGVSGFLLDISTLYVFKELFHIKPVTAVIINQILIINYIFFLNKYFTFKTNGFTKHQIVKFYILAGANYLISIIWMLFFNEYLAINYLFVRSANIILSISWNFLFYKFWVFRVSSNNIFSKSS